MISRKAKIFMSITICMYYMIRGIDHFIYSPEDDSTLLRLPGGYSISVYSEMVDAEYSLCVFMLKQSLTLILNRDRCVNVVQRPYIKWD